MRGEIKSYSYTKGYGFITSEVGELFFRYFDCNNNSRKLKEGRKVIFLPIESSKGLRATDVTII